MRAALFLLFFLLTPQALGLGIAQQYHENGTIVLNPGEVHEHPINLQNQEDHEIQVNLSVYHNWTRLPGGSSEIVTLPPNSHNTHRSVTITVPEDAQPGTRVTARLIAQPLSTGEGQVGMGIRINDKFDILIEEPPQEELALSGDGSWWRIAATALLLTAILGILYAQSSRISRGVTRMRGRGAKPFMLFGVPARSPEEVALLLHEGPDELPWRDVAAAVADWVYDRTGVEEHRYAIACANTKEELVRTLLFGL